MREGSVAVYMKSKFSAKKAEQWEHEIITSHEDLKEWLYYESRKYNSRTKIGNFICLTEQDYIWKYQRLLRKTEYYLNTGRKLRFYLAMVLLNRWRIKYGMNIRLNSCGKGLKIMHIGSILTNGDIGRDCRLHINVSIVSGGKEQMVPTLGDSIVVGVGAIIVGGICLADGIAVGANALVNKTFDERNITIAGVPAKKISSSGSEVWGLEKENHA